MFLMGIYGFQLGVVAGTGEHKASQNPDRGDISQAYTWNVGVSGGDRLHVLPWDVLSWPEEKNEVRPSFLYLFICSVQDCQMMQKYQAADSEKFALHLRFLQRRVKRVHFDWMYL